MSKTSISRATIASSAIVLTGTGIGLYAAIPMTTMVLASQALPGALATKAVTINGTPAVFSLMKASFFSKAVVFTSIFLAGVVIAAVVYKNLKVETK